jgi:dipeptidyl aminopeptidase/acylaminoacyl peptidase
MAPLGYETKDRNSYYGISDLAALATDTHKFELHYIDWLIERYQPGSSLYHDRSPINFVQNLSAPVIFFHGEDDPVVPVNQAKTMFSALKGRGIATCLLIFQGEKHGFLRTRAPVARGGTAVLRHQPDKRPTYLLKADSAPIEA